MSTHLFVIIILAEQRYYNLIISLSVFILSGSTSDGAPQRIAHLHLQGRGADKATLAVRGDNLRIPRFANQQGAWHACADDADDHSSVHGGQVGFKAGLRGGKDPIRDALVVDELAKLARSAATEMENDVSRFFTMTVDDRHLEPADVWKIMSCAVLISEQNGGAWESKEAVQLRSIGLYSKEDVLKQLGFIAWPNDCSEPITLDRDSL